MIKVQFLKMKCGMYSILHGKRAFATLNKQAQQSSISKERQTMKLLKSKYHND